MSGSTLPVLSAPHFPQVFHSAIDSFITRIEAHPQLGTCDYENESVDCREAATVHHLELEKEFCAAHFVKVVGRG